jgi:hypothetical protein
MAILHRNFDGGFYAAAVPRGECIGIMGAAWETLTGGMMAGPPNGMLAPCAGILDGVFCVAGKAQTGGNAWFWNGERWIDLQVEAYGGQGPSCAFGPLGLYVSSIGLSGNVLIFNRQGVLMSSVTQQIGVRGIAKIELDGTVRPVDDWYGDVDGFGIYVRFGDVVIGQGARGGLVAKIGAGPTKLLEPGPWDFLTYGEEGDVFCVAASQWDYFGRGQHRAAVRWFDRRDIELAADYPPVVVDPPIVVPPKPPEPPSMSGITDSQFATLERIRDKYGETLDEKEIGALLNEVAWIHRSEGVGMQRKDGGTNCTQPRTGIKVWRGMRFAGDIGQDVLQAASIGKCIPTRGTAGPADPNTFVAPVEPEGVIDPPPPPPPPPPPGAELEQRVRALEQTVSRIQSLMHSA